MRPATMYVRLNDLDTVVGFRSPALVTAALTVTVLNLSCSTTVFPFGCATVSFIGLPRLTLRAISVEYTSGVTIRSAEISR